MYMIDLPGNANGVIDGDELLKLGKIGKSASPSRSSTGV